MRVRTSLTLLDDDGEPIERGTLFRHQTQDLFWTFLETAVDCIGEPVVRLEIVTDLEGPAGQLFEDVKNAWPEIMKEARIENLSLEGLPPTEVPLCEFLNRWQPVDPRRRRP